MSNKSSLGKALQRQQQKKVKDGIQKVQQSGQFYHDSKEVKEDYQIQQDKLQSIIDQNPINEFLQIAELANVKYNAEKKQEVVQSSKQVIINVNSIKSQASSKVFDYKRNQLMVNLSIPRRPIWNEKTTIEQLREMENESFLKWRRELAKFEEENYQIQLTPYEKNIEVWKQLWRVVEKSDILIQVVDGRDILFCHCNDLVKYVNEDQNRVYRKNQTKLNFLLINKSDLISEQIRIQWNKFLLENKINHMFFSAKQEQEKIDQDKEEFSQDSFINTPMIAHRHALLKEIKNLVQSIREQRQENDQNQFVKDHPEFDENMVIIGMVGYPNVGKSSVINTLCNKKLVGVGARPGKTKHFQTIPLENHLMLCDCPGLIFPNAASTRGEMVCNGVLPIDNIKDYLSPIDLLCERIPKLVFEKLYGLNFAEIQKLDASTLLQAYSDKRGFMTGRGLPDEAKAAKIMLKDYVNGKLLYVKLPPDYAGEQLWQSNFLEHLDDLLKQEKEKPSQIKGPDVDIDNQFENQLMQTAQKNLTNEEILELLTQDDLMKLMEGRKIHGIKLTKEQRREIKFSHDRGEPIDFKKYLKFQQNQKEQVYQTHIQGKKK